jgi:hypothetical protein
VFVASALFATTPPAVHVKSDADALSLQRFDVLWVVTYIDDAGREAIAQAPAASGEIVPLMAVDRERLQSIIDAGKMIATSRHIKLN